MSSEAASLARMGAGTPAYGTSKAALNALSVPRVRAGRRPAVGGEGGRPVAEGTATSSTSSTCPPRRVPASSTRTSRSCPGKTTMRRGRTAQRSCLPPFNDAVPGGRRSGQACCRARRALRQCATSPSLLTAKACRRLMALP
ncbi:hypothetical protein OG379_39115 [Streptomyces sp. NBC_01166]|nr:hypothetical protein OG379_39115 [Streptomyces sp. NBC_01166]